MGAKGPRQVALDLPAAPERPEVAPVLADVERALEEALRATTGRRGRSLRHFDLAAAFFKTAGDLHPETVSLVMAKMLRLDPERLPFIVGRGSHPSALVLSESSQATRAGRAQYHQLVWAIRKMSEREATLAELSRIAETL